MCFQLRDDIFDLTPNQDIGKPVGNDLREGKLTLPVIHALKHTDNAEMHRIAQLVRAGEASQEEQDRLARFTVEQGGIEYARWSMNELRMMAVGLIYESQEPAISEALHAYVDYVVDRNM